MNAFRRGVAGGLFVRLARAVAVGLLVGISGSALTSCSSSAPPPRATRDTTAHVAVLQGSDRDAPTRVLSTECTDCHPHTHDAVLGRGPSASARCGACHASVHDTIQALYAGLTRRAAVRPDPMFVARVQCAECHSDTTLAMRAGAARLAAVDRACTSCHGPKFVGMLPRWSTGMQWRTRAVSEYVNRAAADPRLTTAPSARARIQAAKQTVILVTTAGALHNVRGADALLRSALDSAAAAYTGPGLAVPERPTLGPDPARVSCVGCHYGIEGARDSVFGQPFDHSAHVLRGNVACNACHSAVDYIVPGKHEVDKRHGRTMVTPASCNACHHNATSAVACSTCHAGDARLARAIRVAMPLRLRPPNAPTSRDVAFEHRDHAKVECASCHTARTAVRTTAACATCHQTHHVAVAQCMKCHGSDMHAAHKAADHLACTNCHARETLALLTPDRSFCVSCHADRAAHKGGRECSACHMQSTPSELRKRILSGTR